MIEIRIGTERITTKESIGVNDIKIRNPDRFKTDDNKLKEEGKGQIIDLTI